MKLAIAAAAGAERYAPVTSLEALYVWLVATGAGVPMSVEAEAALQMSGL